MRSIITSAVLATALFGQAFGAKAGHRHQHIHERRAKAAEQKRDEVVVTMDGQVVSWENNYFGPGGASATTSAAVAAATEASTAVADVTSAAVAEKVAVTTAASSASSAVATSSASSGSGLISSQKLTSVASEVLSALKVLTGTNDAYDSSKCIGLGTGGVYQMDITNSASEDIVLVVWSAWDHTTPWDAQTVQVATPNITWPIAASSSISVSFNPALHYDGVISGAMAALYSNTTITSAGIVGNTWVEFTYESTNEWSTTDVSRLIATDGYPVSVQNYKSSLSGSDYVKGDATCLTDMDTCVFVCTNDPVDATCAYTLENCVVGAAGNTASADGQNGGCDFEGYSGISEVVFSDY